MFIFLRTSEIWTTHDEFSPLQFVDALRSFLRDGDTLVFGAYEPSSRALSQFHLLGARQIGAGSIYHTSFHANRDRYPNGSPFEIQVTSEALDTIREMVGWTDGQTDKPLFFDHCLAYRTQNETIPLFCFHDAFTGGGLSLSDFVPESDVGQISALLGVQFAREVNPEEK